MYLSKYFKLSTFTFTVGVDFCTGTQYRFTEVSVFLVQNVLKKQLGRIFIWKLIRPLNNSGWILIT